MAANYKTFSDFEVATAEEAQGYLMDQTVVKVDLDTDLASLPTSVKTAYVLNTGILMARNSVNAWVPQGGAATVSETAPSNPQVGQLWVKPSEVLPLPVRGYMINASKTVTATTFTAVTLDIARSITLPKAAMCDITYTASLIGASTTSVQARGSWSGATTGDTVSQIGGFMGAIWKSSPDSFTQSMTITAALNAGTTNFGIDALRANTSATCTIQYMTISITPVQWADAYADGVS